MSDGYALFGALTRIESKRKTKNSTKHQGTIVAFKPAPHAPIRAKAFSPNTWE